MKKFVTLMMVLAMMLTMFAACGASDTTETTTEATTEETTLNTQETTEETTEGAPAVNTDSLEGIIEAIYVENPTEIMVGSIPVDLTDTSEDGLWMLKNYTGLDSAENITEAVASEAMIGSIPYSMVLVRVAEGADAQAVAEAMKSGIDQRKWICVEADDLMVAGKGDVVMLVMIGSENGNAQSFVDAFSTVMGGTDFVVE